MPTGQYAAADAKPIGEYSLSDVTPTDEPTSRGGLVLAAAGKAIPKAAEMAAEFATNPNVPRLASKAGQALAGIATLGTAATRAAGGDLSGAAYTAAATAPAVWAGGKTGWFTGKLAQKMGAPVAEALEKAAPYAQTLSTLGGAQSVLDLAQMEAPGRTDIGLLGLGRSPTGKPSTEAMKQLPSLLRAVQYAVDTKGVTPSDAIKQVTGNNAEFFGPLMTLYMRSRMKP